MWVYERSKKKYEKDKKAKGIWRLGEDVIDGMKVYGKTGLGSRNMSREKQKRIMAKNWQF